MFNICPNCGDYTVTKLLVRVDGLFGFYECPSCQYLQRILRPLLTIVTGAAGVGKSTVCQRISTSESEVLCLDGDILFVNEFRERPIEYITFVLRVCKNIGQPGLPVLLFGIFFPEQVAESLEAIYFDSILFVGLYSSSSLQKQRLLARPAWREVDDNFLAEQLELNREFQAGGVRGLDCVIGTDVLQPFEVAEEILTRVRRRKY